MKKIVNITFLVILLYILFGICIISFASDVEESEYIGKSLVIETSNIEEVKKDDSIENITEVAEDTYIIDYVDEKSAQEGFDSFGNSDYIEKVLADIEVSILSNESYYVTSSSVNENYIAWGVESTGMDHYTQYLNYKNNDEVLVAVLDTGINANHEAFKNNTTGDRINTSYSYNYISSSTNVSDDQGHGTMVASAIVESTPSNVKIVPIKVLDQNGKGSFLNIINAINSLKDEVDIVNLSLGISRADITDDQFEAYEEILKEIYDDGDGPLIVCAAGNDAVESVSYPASSSYTVAVSALNQTDEKNIEFATEFSNYGEEVDFSAPGQSLYLANYKNNSKYILASGTSAATPFVSSAFALLKTEYQSYNSKELKNKLIENVEDLGSKGKDIYYGYGSVNFIKSIFENPVVANIKKSNINSDSCTLTANAVCDDNITKYTYVDSSGALSSADWIAISDSSTNVEVNFDITKNDTYTIYFMDVEGDVGSYDFVVNELDEKLATTDVAVTKITLDKTSITLTNGNSSTLVATATPLNATNKTVTWSSSNTSVVTVDQNGKLTTKGVGTATITAKAGSKSATCKVVVNARTPSIKYRTHVQNIGWQSYVSNGTTAGTTGKSLRLEGINISLESADISGGIEYRTHVQNIGWQSYVSNGKMSGTSGKSLRLEAIQIRLTGDISKEYDVYYRVHSQDFGWLGWAKNGDEAGTAGYSYRLEGIQIKLVKKGGNAPGSTQNSFKQNIFYQTHIQNVGWQNYVNAPQISGTTGQGLRLEGIRIKLPDEINISGNIEYSVHVQNIGWQNFVRNNVMAGTSGRSLRLEAIRIRLTGNLANKYDIYYRVHCQNFGWLGWAKNGESAGSEGYSYRLEGIQIELVKKGESSPGSTSRTFVKK